VEGGDRLNRFHHWLCVPSRSCRTNPDTFGVRLEAAGFQVLEVEKNSGHFGFAHGGQQLVEMNVRTPCADMS
jgi:hypothetical protein